MWVPGQTAYPENRCVCGRTVHGIFETIIVGGKSSMLERLAHHKKSISEQQPQSADQNKPKNTPEL